MTMGPLEISDDKVPCPIIGRALDPRSVLHLDWTLSFSPMAERGQIAYDGNISPPQSLTCV